MNLPDVDRINEARRRLREAGAGRPRHDAAIRIVRLDSPRSGGAQLDVHPGMAVVTGLSANAHEEVVATVAALHRSTPLVGLGGEVLVDGRHVALHDPAIGPIPRTSSVTAIDELPLEDLSVDGLGELVEALQNAVALTSAELRGADAAARELRADAVDPPDVIDLRTTDEDRLEIKETLDALSAIEPDEKLVLRLGELLEQLEDADSDALSSTVEQYSAALERVLPSDPAEVRAELEAALDEAIDARQRQDRERDAALFGVVDLLAELGIVADRSTAVERAERILVERQELLAIRERLRAKLAVPTPRRRPAEPSPHLARIEGRVQHLKRELFTQRLLQGAAQDVLGIVGQRGGGAGADVPAPVVGTTNDRGRPLPILLVEPTADLPSRCRPTLLSLLVRLADTTQMIVTTSDHEAIRWAAGAGPTVGISRAAGWFAGVRES